MNAYILLILAIISEVFGSSMLKATNGFKKLLPSLGVALGYGIAFYALSLSLKTLPLGLVYAIWSGLGTALTALVGIFIYKENFNDFSRSHNYNRKYFIYFFLLIFFTAIFYIKVANINRERLFIEKGYGKELIENGGVKPFDPKKKPTSLEGKLRLWYYINFEKKDTINK